MSVDVTVDGRSARVKCILPILNVKDLNASLDYYQKVLGFVVDWGGNPGDTMASVSRDNCGIMLCQGSQGQSGTWVWIGVSDVRTLYRAFQAGGANIVQEPTNYSWALEIRVEDPDGHMLRFGSDPSPELPFADRQAGR